MAFTVTKLTMLVGYLALAAGSHPRLLSSSVTYTNRGARLERLLPELSKACGLELVPDKRMRGVVLTLRLQGAPTTEVLKKIAYAARGKWEEAGTTYVLHSDDVGIAAVQAAEAAQWRAKVQRMIASSKAFLAAKKPGETDPSPTAVAIAKLLQSMDISPLLRDDWSRLIFSTQPKPLQLPLPGGADAIFSEMADGIRSRESDTNYDSFRPIRYQVWALGAPTRTNLAIEHPSQWSDGSFTFEMTCFDDRGKVMGSTAITLRDPTEASAQHQNIPAVNRWGIVNSPADDKGGGADAKEVGIPPSKHVSDPLPLTPLELAFIRAESDAETPISPAIRALLMHPLEHDPVELSGGILNEYAERNHIQLVAGMSDPLARDLAEAGTNEDEVLRVIKSFGAVWPDGWLLTRRIAEDPQHDSWLFDRHKLQAFVNSVVDDPLPNLETLIYAERLGLADVGGLGFAQEVIYRNLVEAETESNRQLALLSDDELKSLLGGKRILLSDTPQAFQDVFSEECIQSARSLRRDNQPDEAFDEEIEPTEIVDSKIPFGAYLVLDQSEKICLQRPQENRSYKTYSTIDEIAADVVSNEKVGSFRIGKEHTYTLKVYLVPGIYWEATGSIHSVPNKPFLSVTQFPAELKAALRKLVEEKRKQQGGDETHGGGGTPPPP